MKNKRKSLFFQLKYYIKNINKNENLLVTSVKGFLA